MIMEVNSRTEFAIFFYTLHHPELIPKCKPDFFSDDTTKGLYEISAPFVAKYKECPSAEEVKQLIAASDWTPQQKDKINDETVDLLWRDSETYKTIYDQTWMTEQVEAFYRYQTLMKGIRETISYVKLNSENFTIENCREMTDKIQNMFTMKTTVSFADTGEGTDFFDPKSHRTVKLKHFSTGYSFIDRASDGGYWPGSLWVFLGAPKAGKSRLLQNLTAMSVKQGYDTAYISLELQEEMITQRIGSNMLGVKMNDYTKFAENEDNVSEKLRELSTQGNIFSYPGALRIKEFPTSTLTVTDLESWLLKEEEHISETLKSKFKFKCVYVDYINIMKNWKNPNSENTYLKIKQIAEDLRAIAMKNGWCIITATQLKQSFFTASDVDMTAAAESSALQATVDMMYAIICTPIMSLQHEMYVKSLLSRVSPNVNERKKYIIVEDYMRLIEDPDSKIINDEQFASETIKKAEQIKKGISMPVFNNKKKEAYNPAVSKINAVLSRTENPQIPLFNNQNIDSKSDTNLGNLCFGADSVS